MPRTTALLFAAVLLVPVHPAIGQRSRQSDPSPVAVGFSVSTLGLGPELSLHLAPRFGLRAGFHYLSLSLDEDVEDVQYEIRPKWQNLTALADVHPFANAFRLTGGLVLWNTSAEGEAALTEPVEIGDRVYQPSEVGSLIGTADYPRSIAPYFGLGVAGRGRVAVTFDLGVVVTGHPTIDLTVNSPLTGPERAQLLADLQLEEESIQQDIDDSSLARLYPVVSLGLKLRF